MADLGSSFVSGIIQAQQLGMDRRRLRIAEENAASLKNYYDSQIKAQDALQKPLDAQNRISRFFSTDTLFNMDAASGELEPGWADFLTATNAQGVSQHYADREHIRQDKENNRRIDFLNSPIGKAMDAASGFNKTAEGTLSTLSISDGTNVLAEAEDRKSVV